MCDDDGMDVDDIAFAFGFVDTMIEGEKKEQDPEDPSPADTLKTDLDYLDEED
jgi:hypothetical protein